LKHRRLRRCSRAENLLHDLGATDLNGQITAIGRQMSKFPLHPRFSRMLLAAAEFGCLREAALCAAVAQGRDILLVGKNNASHKNEEFWENGDVSEFQALLRAFTRAEGMNFDPDACARYGVHAWRRVKPPAARISSSSSPNAPV
jgi:ATP-dependent helicase HrpB